MLTPIPVMPRVGSLLFITRGEDAFRIIYRIEGDRVYYFSNRWGKCDGGLESMKLRIMRGSMKVEVF